MKNFGNILVNNYKLALMLIACSLGTVGVVHAQISMDDYSKNVYCAQVKLAFNLTYYQICDGMGHAGYSLEKMKTVIDKAVKQHKCVDFADEIVISSLKKTTNFYCQKQSIYIGFAKQGSLKAYEKAWDAEVKAWDAEVKAAAEKEEREEKASCNAVIDKLEKDPTALDYIDLPMRDTRISYCARLTNRKDPTYELRQQEAAEKAAKIAQETADRLKREEELEKAWKERIMLADVEGCDSIGKLLPLRKTMQDSIKIYRNIEQAKDDRNLYYKYPANERRAAMDNYLRIGSDEIVAIYKRLNNIDVWKRTKKKVEDEWNAHNRLRLNTNEADSLTIKEISAFCKEIRKKEKEQELKKIAANIDWYSESANEFTITTAKQLAGFAELVNKGNSFKNKTIKLGANIMLNDTVNWQNWVSNAPNNTWISIGTKDNIFEGTFDGKGYTISGVYIKNGLGLFKNMDTSGTIENLGVIASYVKGDIFVGGLVGGRNYGTVSNSYFIGTVTGDTTVGGLVGINRGTISNSYSICKALGEIGIGGLVGRNRGKISNSYSASTVTGDRYIGGLVGKNDENGKIINSYYDSQINNQSNTLVKGNGNGKITANMKKESTFKDWDFDKTWGINSKINNGYPYLLENTEQQTDFAQAVWNGTASIDWYDESTNEFTITTAEQLAGLAKLVNNGNNFKSKIVKLGANIMLNDTASWENWASKPPANKWIPIGVSNKWFNGTFEGSGYVVSGVYINNSNKRQGLFELVDSSGTIKNLGVVASYIKGGFLNGGLAGFNDVGTISDSYFVGMVTGDSVVGGLIGGNGGEIINSYSIGSVKGQKHIGGLVGIVYIKRKVINSHFSGTVMGEMSVGGLVGINGGQLSNSYSIGMVTGTSCVGGLVGWNGDQIKISNSYSTATVTAEDWAGGLVGSNLGTISNSYSTGTIIVADFKAGGLVGDNGGEIINSYSLGSVKGQKQIGGLVGANYTMLSAEGISEEGNYLLAPRENILVGTIRNSYSIGMVTGNSSVGGLVGDRPKQSSSRNVSQNIDTVINSYYDKQTSKQSHDVTGDGKITAQMKQKETFRGWDFDKTWGINSKINNGYPYLLENKGQP